MSIKELSDEILALEGELKLLSAWDGKIHQMSMTLYLTIPGYGNPQMIGLREWILDYTRSEMNQLVDAYIDFAIKRLVAFKRQLIEELKS